MKALLKDRLRKAIESKLSEIVDEILSKCIECGADAQHLHHLVPRVHNGQTVVPVCNECHGNVHDLNFTNHKELIKAGMRKAADEGRYYMVDDSMYKAIAKRLEDGWTYRQIAEKYKVGRSTITKAKRSYSQSSF